MSGVGQSIRRALGLPSVAPQAQRVPFFGTYRTLLQVFGAGIKYRQTMEELRQVAKRKGISAKSPYARAKGALPHGPRRARATGPNSYAAESPQQESNRRKRQLSALYRHDHEVHYGPTDLHFNVTAAEARRFVRNNPGVLA